MKNPEHDLGKLLRECGVQIKFGLRAQGHIPTIQHMLSEGRSWQEIGKAIHWDPETARKWFERLEKPPED